MNEKENEEISVYNANLGQFIELSVSENTVSIKLTNSQPDIMLFYIAPEESPLYTTIFDKTTGMCLENETKVVTMKVYPEFGLREVKIPYSIPIVLAHTALSNFKDITSSTFLPSNLQQKYKGQRYYLSIIINRATKGEFITVNDLEFIDFSRYELYSVENTAKPSVFFELQKALILLESRYNYFLEQSAEDTVIKPYESALLRMKLAIDYWKFLGYEDRINLLHDFIKLLKQPLFCPICFKSVASEPVLFCSHCGSYIGCCQEHAAKFNSLHQAECEDFERVSILKYLQQHEMQSAISEISEQREQHLNDESSVERDKWIEEVTSEISVTEQLLNEICDFSTDKKQNANCEEIDLKKIVELSQVDTQDYEDAQKSIQEIAAQFDSLEAQREQMKAYLQTRFSEGKREFGETTVEEEKASIGSEATGLPENINDIVQKCTNEKGAKSYTKALEEIEEIYQRAVDYLKEQVRMYKCNVGILNENLQEIHEDLSNAYTKLASQDRQGQLDNGQHTIGDCDVELHEELAAIFAPDAVIASTSATNSEFQYISGCIAKVMQIQTRSCDLERRTRDAEATNEQLIQQLSEEQKEQQKQLFQMREYQGIQSELSAMQRQIEDSIVDKEFYCAMKSAGAVDFLQLKSASSRKEENKHLDAPVIQLQQQSVSGESVAREHPMDKQYEQEPLICSIVDARVSINSYQELENFSETLVQFARQYNGIEESDEKTYFELLELGQQVYGVVFVNLQRLLQEQLSKFQIQKNLSFGDAVLLRRQVESILEPFELKQFIGQWTSVLDEYETLMREIERQLYYSMACAPNVLVKWPKKRLDVPVIDFKRLKQEDALIMLDSVPDL